MTYLRAGTCLLMLLLAAGIRWRCSRTGKRLLIGGLAGLFFWAWPPVAALFSGSLEWRYPMRRFPAGDGEAMVVLSGAIYRADDSQPELLPGYDTYLRCRYAAWLYRNWKALPIVASGGPAGGHPPQILADVMAQVLEQAGVPAAGIWKERESQSTYENAVYSVRLLREKGIRRIVLVTEAFHMRRAEACFRKQGVEVTPAAFGRRSARFENAFNAYVPTPSATSENEDSLHEWVGLAWYHLTGKI
jgi:uncharacterized SAM-binding protein YcdF (DUF218 family)